MENNGSTEFEFHKDEANNFIRLDGRMQVSILRTMYGVENRFCDVELTGLPPPDAPDTVLQPIHAHKSVLACASEHLLKLFKHTDRHQSAYEIGAVDHQNLGRIVEYIYTNRVTTGIGSPVEVMCGILIGADYLLMKCLADACDTFLAGTEQVKPENCIKLWVFGRKYGCLKLLHATSTFIADNLAALSNDVEFLGMPYEDCAKLLMSEAFVTASANQRCLAAIAWLESESAGRASHVSDILNMIPLVFGSVSIDTVHAALKSEMLWEHAPLAMRKLSVSITEKVVSAQIVGGGGICDLSTRSWFVLGGEDTPGLFLHYNTNLCVWSKLPELPWPRLEFGACAMGSRLIAVGGYKNEEPSYDIDEYDFPSKTWSTSTAQLSVGDCTYGNVACSDDQGAYVMGGWGTHCDTVETYDWKSRLIEKRLIQGVGFSGEMLHMFAAVISVDKNSLYCVTGRSAKNPCTKVEKFEIANNKWKTLHQMTTAKRHYLAAALSGDDLYLMGGVVNFSGRSNAVEVLNIRTGQLRPERNLTKARSHCRAMTLHNGTLVCVLGGKGDGVFETLSSVEVFDKREGIWSTGTIVPDMPVPSYQFAFAAV